MWAEGTECWCEALTPSQVCELDFSAEAERLRGTPAYAVTLFRLVHDRLERSSAHVVTLGRLDGMERLCGFLAELARRTGAQRGDGWTVSLPMSREDIADYLGLNTDTVSRLMTRIKKAGLARFRSPSLYEVPDLARLEARVPFSLARGIKDAPPEERDMIE
jgi:CRP-like cAMP-binding protein